MSKKGSKNYILHAKSKQFFWEGNGQLSIKTFTNGKAFYKTNRGFFSVEEDRYLLLNKGSYTISIDEKNEVESFCIFFRDGLAEEVLPSIIKSIDAILSDPDYNMESVEFFEKTYHFTPMLKLQLEKFQRDHDLFADDMLWLDEQYHNLMQIMLFAHFNALNKMESLNTIKNSTREELFRRVTVAHDYIRSYYNHLINLQDISSAACLSQNHLLRNYKKIYGKTPHQHISEMRIHKALKLLEDMELSMTDITYEIGFNNPVSFSKIFKTLTGLSPLQYRKKVILDKN
ncbi:helix-turn-helix domain-containing protein [Bacillus sp. CGMCC 1.16607]|uniref:helix-turn-helix domain-containing protein n=1 Tax=Bacillus sp. CGMCC 1.16607 TaxID=3351842 RepID=UPI00362BA496